MLSRRAFFGALGALSCSPLFDPGMASGAYSAKKNLFSLEKLLKRAEIMAMQPYTPPPVRAREILEKIDFEQHNAISFKPEHTLPLPGSFPVQFFHLGKFFQEPVFVFVVDGGFYRKIPYSPQLFHFGEKAKFAQKLPADLGFAGFKVKNPNLEGDWLAYLGASYFRSAGPLEQYGLSARALAVNTAVPGTAEEFPRFSEFYLESRKTSLKVYALLDGPSVTGVFEFEWHKDQTITADITAHLFMRQDIARLGWAPLTGMYWYSETNRRMGLDWRPEVHDCDGLELWTGTGEHLFRPLNNPPQVMTSSFADQTPKGFGLMQRDRRFENYEDDGVFYEKRPSVWIEPLNDWGKGAVQLVEIPTNVEINDNIVAYWVGDTLVRKGQHQTFSYRLHWGLEAPFPISLARVVATRCGRGGRPAETGKKGVVKYIIDFEGAGIERYVFSDGLVPHVSASNNAHLEDLYAVRVNTTNRWRLGFDLRTETSAPTELRAFLALPNGTPLTQTWIYQHHPLSF